MNIPLQTMVKAQQLGNHAKLNPSPGESSIEGIPNYKNGMLYTGTLIVIGEIITFILYLFRKAGQ